MTDLKKAKRPHPRLTAFAIGALLGSGVAAIMVLVFYFMVFRTLFLGG